MNKEQKQELINEIVGILHKDAEAMYEAKGSEDEARIALDEDYFEDVAESVLNYCENMFSYLNRKSLAQPPEFKSVISKLVKEAIDNFNTKWTSYEEQVDGINDISMRIAFSVNLHYSERIAYLDKEVDRLRSKEEELGNRLAKADNNAKSRLDNYNQLQFENIRLNAKLEHYSEIIERCDFLQEDRDRYKFKYEDLLTALNTPCKDPNE